MKNYIGNNNQINKKKYKKSLPPKLNPDAGNVEHNINMFNKVSSGDANLSSAAGMNGMAESYDRDSIIARIVEFGKHYNFEKYTDAQLNAILNRLVDASNHTKKVLPKHQDKINIKSERHIMNDDPSYNFDDPDREGEYRVENLREALNRLDHYCIDNDKQFHDLRSLYENIQHQLTPQEKQELKKLVDTTNDPDAIKAYIDSKDPDKKNEELEEEYLSEDMNATDIVDWMYWNFPNWDYLGEKSLSDGTIQLIFFDTSAIKGKRTEIPQEFIDALDNQKFNYKFLMSNHRLCIIANDYDLTSFDDSEIEYTDVDFDESLNEDLSEEDFEGEIFDIFDILADAAIAAGGDSDDISGDIESSDYLMDRLTCSFTSTTEISNKNFIEKIKKSIEQALENQTRFKNDIDIYVALNRYSDLPAELTKKYKNYIIEIEAYADDNDPLSRANWSDETDVDFDESVNLDEGLNRKELETFSRAIFNAGDKEEAQKIIDEIYQYDKTLSLRLKHMWDDSASDAYNADKLSGYLLRYNESLDEGVFDTLKAKRQARLDKIDAKKRSQDPIYDAMRRYELGEPSREDDPKLHPELDPRNFIYDSKFQSQKDRFGNPRRVPDNVISVVIKSDVDAISTDAFKDHKNLKEVRFEGKTDMIHSRAFMNCTSLTYIELPKSLLTIQSEAFKNCTSLRWIKFQADQFSLANNALEGCKSLNFKAILQKYLYEVDQERTKLYNSYEFNVTIYRKKKKSVDESMNIDSALLLQGLLNQYPDISLEDEDYLNSLSYSDLVREIKNRGWEDVLTEDTVKQGNKWVNKGKEGTHGKFKTKKAADAQRKAMFANGYKGESLQEDISDDNYSEVQVGDTVYHKDYEEGTVEKFDYKSTPSREDTIYVTFSKDQYGNELGSKITRIFPFPRAFQVGWLRWLNHPDSIELNDLDIQYTDVDFDESLTEDVYRYTVECYSDPHDEPARYRFYDHDDAERFAVDCARSKKYTEVFITSPRRYGFSVENSWSKETGWYKEPNFLIELNNDDIEYTDVDFDESLKLKKKRR